MKRFVAILLSFTLCLGVSAQIKEIGITLSGGGALGFAHIGVLQALEDCGIKPDIVSGTSMGALIAAMYANGLSPQDIFEMVKVEQFDRIASFTNISIKNIRDLGGASSHEKLHTLLLKYLPHNSFDSLEIPCYVFISNLTKERGEVHHSGGRLVEYLEASSAIPGVFAPVVIDSSICVDGGVFNNLPAQYIRSHCKVLIAVDVNPAEFRKPMKKINDILQRSLSLLIYENTREGRAVCDHIIKVPVNFTYSSMDFNKFYNIYQIGYRTGLDYVRNHPELQKLKK